MLLYSNRENNPSHRGGVSMALRAFPSAPCAAPNALCMLLSPWALCMFLKHHWQNASEGLVMEPVSPEPETNPAQEVALICFCLCSSLLSLGRALCLHQSFAASSCPDCASQHFQRSVGKAWELGDIQEMRSSKIHYKSAVHPHSLWRAPLDFQNMTDLPFIFIPRQKIELFPCISFLRGNHIKWRCVGMYSIFEVHTSIYRQIEVTALFLTPLSNITFAL